MPMSGSGANGLRSCSEISSGLQNSTFSALRLHGGSPPFLVCRVTRHYGELAATFEPDPPDGPPVFLLFRRMRPHEFLVDVGAPARPLRQYEVAVLDDRGHGDDVVFPCHV